MKIVFTELDRGWILTIPVVPSDFSWSNTRKRNVYEAILQDVDDVGNKGLREFNISSFAPDKGSIQGKKYAFQKTATPGRAVIKALEFWVDNKTALRMVVTAKDGRTLLNVIVKMTGITMNLDRVGDYVYSLDIAEHVPLYT